MPRWLKIILGILVTFIIVFIIAGFIFYQMLISSLPEYKGEADAEGIAGKVEIFRDSMAVPYIFAANEEDAAFALGYVHAQERLFQMDMMRRAGEGRLSEIFGSATLPFDQMFRVIGIKRTVDQNIKKINPAGLKLLQAYSKGVNLYIHHAKGKYPVEFDVLNYDPYEWKPEHSLIIARMLAWELNISWWTDISFTYLIQKLGEEKVKSIIPDYPENAPVIIPPELKSYPPISMSIIKADREFRKFMGMDGNHLGSNNWVINAKLSESGYPIIANDTHLHYTAPGTWFTAVIRGGKWQAEGFTLPGVPAVVIGKNNNISWAVTNIMLDDADFYAEKLDSAKKNYFFNGKWIPLKILEEKIKVKDSSDVEIEVQFTHRGPIISGIHPYKYFYPNESLQQKSVLSMRWIGNDFSDELFSFYQINRASNWDEFKSAFQNYSVPGQNFVYADKQGNIGYLFGGRLPIRTAGSTSFVYDGTTDEHDWKGYVSAPEIPSILNPGANFIASANNKTLKNFKYHISNLWEPSSRIERIIELLSSKPKHSSSDFKKYQLDIVSPYAEKIVKYILDAFQGLQINDRNLQVSLDFFRNWDYKLDEFSQVPSIYALFYKHLLEDIYKDEMGEDLFQEFIFVENVPYRTVMKTLNDSTSAWFDNINTRQLEGRNDIIRKSFVEALSDLENKFGKDPAAWQWGKLHKVVMKHAFGGVSRILDNYINIGPTGIGGDGTTVFNTEYPFMKGIQGFPRFNTESFENNVGPAMRYIFDFSKPEEFYMILSTGQSGNLMSDHFRDMFGMWIRGDYITIRTDEGSIRRNPDKFVLNPMR
ncbi:MAG TPA: penicillin acylase family protein [Ignavibacteriaceae bacterium]|nr:penicillin acylase family protein [Ignavibacteriaceae bacterium]